MWVSECGVWVSECTVWVSERGVWVSECRVWGCGQHPTPTPDTRHPTPHTLHPTPYTLILLVGVGVPVVEGAPGGYAAKVVGVEIETGGPEQLGDRLVVRVRHRLLVSVGAV